MPSPTLSPTDPVPRGQLWPTGSVGTIAEARGGMMRAMVRGKAQKYADAVNNEGRLARAASLRTACLRTPRCAQAAARACSRRAHAQGLPCDTG